MRGFAVLILALTAGVSYAIEVKLESEVQTPSPATIRGTTNLSLPRISGQIKNWLSRN
jgi:hypothetical protein